MAAWTGLELGLGEYLAAVILGMISLSAWAWFTRPAPNPYEERAYDPQDPTEGL